MNEIDKKKFAEIMYGVADNFGGQISTQGLQLKFDALAELSIEQVAFAATYLVRHRKTSYPPVPTVKEFIDAAKGLELEVSQRSKAEIQANKVLSKLRYHGRAGKADFADPITQELMTTRWPYRVWACYILEKDIVWWKKEFIESYQAYSEQQAAGQLRLIYSRKESLQDLTKLACCTVKRIDDRGNKLEGF